MSSIDLNIYINKTYGSYTIKKFVEFRNYKKSRCPIYECLCECGKIKNVGLWDLKKGTSNSCGCSRIKSAIKKFKKTGPQKVIKNYKHHAIKRNYLFKLTDEECIKLIERKCHYCGTLPQNTIKSFNNHAKYKYNGIDRIDNNEGYVKYNCVSCCWSCNNMKGKLDLETFMKHIQKIYNQITIEANGT
jgi:hypothetical protein